jgi:hypothetical protein
LVWPSAPQCAQFPKIATSQSGFILAASARAILASHIIEAAKQGERDQGRLRDGALLAFAQANLRTAPMTAF